jgi:hypothetical protein
MATWWQITDFKMFLYMGAVLAFLIWCVVVGSRRWDEVKRLNKKSLDMSTEAIADRKKILSVLEEIKKLLEDRKA